MMFSRVIVVAACLLSSSLAAPADGTPSTSTQVSAALQGSKLTLVAPISYRPFKSTKHNTCVSLQPLYHHSKGSITHSISLYPQAETAAGCNFDLTDQSLSSGSYYTRACTVSTNFKVKFAFSTGNSMDIFFGDKDVDADGNLVYMSGTNKHLEFSI
jgi:hypothetical protein